MHKIENVKDVCARMTEALAETRTLAPQRTVEVIPGLQVRRTAGGIPVLRVHYSVLAERDPRLNPEWRAKERKKYTSRAAWDREQEIIDEAGGGELVFADTLVTHWNRIVITDPKWRPDPKWRVIAGFDHGKTNPTVLERCYLDYQGCIYFCGEYYQPGWEVWQHAPVLKTMQHIRKIEVAYADPTIFDATMQQSNQPTRSGMGQERAKSINELYIEQGIELFTPFYGDRSDISFAASLMTHWSNLEEREPSVRIVCRNYAEKPVPGLHQWDCPNLLWELMRTRRVKLSSQQLLSRNLSEAIVDKDNHARDACKYILMSHPQATEKTVQEELEERLRPLIDCGDLTSAMIRYNQITAKPTYQPAYLGRCRPRRSWRL
jgi:hypothetical protein